MFASSSSNPKSARLVSNQPYRFSPLDGDKEIRLFYLTSQCTSNDIHIHIEHYRLNALPPYECISYTWGDMTNLKLVYADLGAVNVSHNLWNALQRVRGREPVRFWADQICIDQKSNAEKSAQVPLMSTIFPKAKEVLCWLGKDVRTEKQVHQAIGILRQWSQVGEDQRMRIKLMNQLGTHNDQNHPQQTALRTFFSCKWFQRVWTLQEVFVSKRNPPAVLCPWCPCEISWESLRIAFMTLVQTLPNNFSAHVLGDDVRFVHAMFIAYHNRESKKMKFSSLLQQTAERGVTRGRDRVYGLLSIMQQQDPNMRWPEPDYRQETIKTSIFMAYTRRIIEYEGTLDILSFKKHATPSDNISSWAFEPENMTAIGSLLLPEDIAATHPRWSACRSSRALLAPQSLENDRILSLYGVHIDTIARVFSLQTFLQRVAGKPGTGWRTRWSDVQNEGGRLAQEVRSTGVRISGEKDPGSAILKTLVINDFWTLSHDPRQEYETEATRLYGVYLATRNADANGQASAGAEINQREGQRIHNDLIEIARRNFQFSNSEPLSRDSRAPDWMDSAVTYDLYKNLKWKLKDMQLAITTNGRLALVPHIAAPKDNICVLLGGYFPLVLRSSRGVFQSKKSAVYRLMGPAFMRELVDGQALEQYFAKRKKSPKRKPEDGLELFNLG